MGESAGILPPLNGILNKPVRRVLPSQHVNSFLTSLLQSSGVCQAFVEEMPRLLRKRCVVGEVNRLDLLSSRHGSARSA